MDGGCDLLVFQVISQDFGVGSGNILSLEIADSFVGGAFGDGESESAFGEAQLFEQDDFFVFFGYLILTDNTQVRYAIRYIARDVIVSEKKEFDGKIGGGGLEFACSIVKLDATLFDKAE